MRTTNTPATPLLGLSHRWDVLSGVRVLTLFDRRGIHYVVSETENAVQAALAVLKTSQDGRTSLEDASLANKVIPAMRTYVFGKNSQESIRKWHALPRSVREQWEMTVILVATRELANRVADRSHTSEHAPDAMGDDDLQARVEARLRRCYRFGTGGSLERVSNR